MNEVLNRTAVVDSNWRFDNLCGSHLQSQSELYNVSWWYYTLVIDVIGQFCRDVIGGLSVKPWCYWLCTLFHYCMLSQWIIINFSMILTTFHFCTTHVTKSWGIWCLINKLKCWKHNNYLLSIFLFLTRTAWMFACDLWCSRKTLPCFFGRCPLIFVEITYVKQCVDVLYFKKDTKEYSLFRKITKQDFKLQYE